MSEKKSILLDVFGVDVPCRYCKGDRGKPRYMFISMREDGTGFRGTVVCGYSGCHDKLYAKEMCVPDTGRAALEVVKKRAALARRKIAKYDPKARLYAVGLDYVYARLADLTKLEMSEEQRMTLHYLMCGMEGSSISPDSAEGGLLYAAGSVLREHAAHVEENVQHAIEANQSVEDEHA